MAITPLPPAPLPSDSTSEFNSKAFAFVAALDPMVTQINAELPTIDAAADASAAAVAAANFKGEWSTLTGALAIPASVSHNGSVWVLTQSLANVTSNEPGVDSPNYWISVTLPAPGTSGNILTSNGTNWTSAAPAPSAGTLQAVATGSLSDGSKVVINADGTVSVIASSNTPSFESPTTFDSSTIYAVSAVYDSTNQKIVVAYRDGGNSNYGTAIVGTVSGSSISFGTPVVFNTSLTAYTSIAHDVLNNRIVIGYTQSSGYVRAIVGTMSGTSISFGSAVTVNNLESFFVCTTYDNANQKIVIAYRDNLEIGKAVVGTVSGTSISFGSIVTFNNNSTSHISIIYDTTNQRVVIAYRNGGNSNYGTAIVGTVSSTSISFGTAVVFESASTEFTACAYDSTNSKIVIAYKDAGNSNYGTAVVGTVSGTSISFGTPVVFATSRADDNSSGYDVNNQKIVICYRDHGNSRFGTAVTGTVSGTSISFGTPVVFDAAYVDPGTSALIYDSVNQKLVLAYEAGDPSNQGKARLTQGITTNLTAENYIGISSAAYTNGQTATIQTVGSVDDAQSSLTAGQSYYVQPNGTIGLTPASPSVFAGTAVSATKLIIKG
jgi:hypothetical protein